MTYRFTISHSLPERTRIRWAGEPGDRGQVEELALKIEDLSGVEKADARPNTGSIVIRHEVVDWQDLQQQLEDRLSIQVCAQSQQRPATGLETFNRGVDRLDGKLGEANIDLNSLGFLFLIVMSVAQAARGQFSVSGFSFLWYALTVASRAARSAPSGLEETGSTEKLRSL